MDCRRVSQEVYDLAQSPDDELGPLVKQALDVIDETLDAHGSATTYLNIVANCAEFMQT